MWKARTYRQNATRESHRDRLLNRAIWDFVTRSKCAKKVTFDTAEIE